MWHRRLPLLDAEGAAAASRGCRDWLPEITPRRGEARDPLSVLAGVLAKTRLNDDVAPQSQGQRLFHAQRGHRHLHLALFILIFIFIPAAGLRIAGRQEAVRHQSRNEGLLLPALPLQLPQHAARV